MAKKKSGNEGYAEVDSATLEAMATELQDVADSFRLLAATIRKERLPPIGLPIASRKTAIKTLTGLTDRLDGFLRQHRRDAGEAAAKTRFTKDQGKAGD